MMLSPSVDGLSLSASWVTHPKAIACIAAITVCHKSPPSYGTAGPSQPARCALARGKRIELVWRAMLKRGGLGSRPHWILLSGTLLLQNTRGPQCLTDEFSNGDAGVGSSSFQPPHFIALEFNIDGVVAPLTRHMTLRG